MYRDNTTGALVNQIEKVRYNHDAMIDLIIAEPAISQGQLARIFDRTEPWISVVINSDAFQARLAERKAELVDPQIRGMIEARFKAVAEKSLDRILEKLHGHVPLEDKFLIETAKLAGGALGYGAKAPVQQTNVAVVVQVPQKYASSADWAANVMQPAGA